jgi:hypothetical protein
MFKDRPENIARKPWVKFKEAVRKAMGDAEIPIETSATRATRGGIARSTDMVRRPKK